eukprot:PhM_4_TR17061/c0_g1_i1/m.30820
MSSAATNVLNTMELCFQQQQRQFELCYAIAAALKDVRSGASFQRRIGLEHLLSLLRGLDPTDVEAPSFAKLSLSQDVASAVSLLTLQTTALHVGAVGGDAPPHSIVRVSWQEKVLALRILQGLAVLSPNLERPRQATLPYLYSNVIENILVPELNNFIMNISTTLHQQNELCNNSTGANNFAIANPSSTISSVRSGVGSVATPTTTTTTTSASEHLLLMSKQQICASLDFLSASFTKEAQIELLRSNPDAIRILVSLVVCGGGDGDLSTPTPTTSQSNNNNNSTFVNSPLGTSNGHHRQQQQPLSESSLLLDLRCHILEFMSLIHVMLHHETSKKHTGGGSGLGDSSAPLTPSSTSTGLAKRYEQIVHESLRLSHGGTSRWASASESALHDATMSIFSTASHCIGVGGMAFDEQSKRWHVMAILKSLECY